MLIVRAILTVLLTVIAATPSVAGTTCYVSAGGVFLGGFDGAPPPVGAIATPTCPQRADQTWNGAAWSAVPPLELPGVMQQSLGSIFTGTDAQRMRRMVDVIDKKPSLGVAMLLLTLPAPLPPDRSGLIKQVTADVKAVIGTPLEILTQTEYDALAALAASKGLPGIVAGQPKTGTLASPTIAQ